MAVEAEQEKNTPILALSYSDEGTGRELQRSKVTERVEITDTIAFTDLNADGHLLDNLSERRVCSQRPIFCCREKVL